jgi:hypothetical protein
MKTAVLNDLVLNNLEVLRSVFRDAARYIIATVPKKSANTRGDQLTGFLQNSDVGSLPFIQMWGLEILCARPDIATVHTAARIAAGAAPQIATRYAALIAQKFGQVDWVRARKENWQNNGPWERRAIIRASSVLPGGERRPWLEMVKESGDIIDRAVAVFTAQQS